MHKEDEILNKSIEKIMEAIKQTATTYEQRDKILQAFYKLNQSLDQQEKISVPEDYLNDFDNPEEDILRLTMKNRNRR